MLQHYPELMVKIEEYRMGLQHTTEKVARYTASIEAHVESIKYKIALLEDFAAVAGEIRKTHCFRFVETQQTLNESSCGGSGIRMSTH
jgi:hypothetical protein